MSGFPPPPPPGTDLWKYPFVPAPPPLTSNLIDPPTNANLAIVPMSIFLAIMIIFIFLRFYARFVMNDNKMWWDDYLILAAVPPQIALTGISIYMTHTGIISRHIWDTPYAVVIFKIPYWTRLISGLPQPITLLVKSSLFLFYYRLFRPNKFVRYGSLVGFVIVVVMYIAWMFVFIYISAQTTIGVRLSVAQSSFNLFTDLYILIMPAIGLWDLHMGSRKKLGIMSVFLTGIAACSMSILSLYYRVYYTPVKSTDPTWIATNTLVANVLELHIGIMCACMPHFMPYFTKLKGSGQWSHYFFSVRSRLFRSSQRSTNRSADTGRDQYDNLSDSGLVIHKTQDVELAERSLSLTDGAANPVRNKAWVNHGNGNTNVSVKGQESKAGGHGYGSRV